MPFSSLPCKINSVREFNEIAIKLFHYQRENNSVYFEYLKAIDFDVSRVENFTQIPFLPISFFKSKKVVSGDWNENKVFRSSGTTGVDRSTHYIKDLSIYEKSFVTHFEFVFGDVSNSQICALLPNYVAQKDASLVYMVNHLIKKSKHPKSAFYLDDKTKLLQKLKDWDDESNVILFGVSFALLDLIQDEKVDLSHTTIIETGGMKGRKEEIIREELHHKLKVGYGVDTVYSEYGMTELLSQAYLGEAQKFNCPPWMKVLIRDVYDPFSVSKTGSGGINVIDFANLNSCSFIATQDLGHLYADGSFDVLGRMDNSEMRGCNLLVV